MRNCWTLLLLLLALTSRAAPRPAAPDTLFLHAVNDGPWAHYFAFCFDADAQPGTGARAAALAAAGRFRPMPPGRVFQAGYTPGRLWLRATVVNTLPQRTRFVWSLYAQVDSAALYGWRGTAYGGGPPRLLARADGHAPLARRALPVRATCLPFWLEAGAKAVLYLRVENSEGATYLPTDLTTTEDFLTYEANFLGQQHWAWLLGLYLSSGVFNLVLFAFLRDRIYLWYGAYVLFATWFLLMEDGLGALLLPAAGFRLGCAVGQFSLLLLALACGLQVMAAFLQLRRGWPWLHGACTGLTVAGATYALAYPVLFKPLLRVLGGGLPALNTGREVLLWTLLLAGVGVLATVGAQGRRAHRRLAVLFAGAYFFFFVGAGQFLLNRSGVVNWHFVEPNTLAWGLALELVTLSVLLTGRFRFALRQNTALRLRHLGEQARAGQRLIAAQDEEREALARELHDALAPGLTALHLAWQGRQVRQALAAAPPLLAEAHQHTEALLRQLRHDVRALNQALMPNPLDEKLNLPAALHLLLETLNLTDQGPLLSCRCDPAAAALPAPLQHAAYRIVAELLHNALRHAQAQHVAVEVHRLAASLYLHVRDDGRGFNPQAPPPTRGGLGLRGVQARARYLRGTCRLVSSPGQGTEVTVELPV